MCYSLSSFDTELNQYDYDVECKLVRVKRPDAETDYCYNYVKHGILRYQIGKYAQSSPPMGTMLGYVQEGNLPVLLNTINSKAKHQELDDIQQREGFNNGGVTHLAQTLQREAVGFVLHHLWADLR